MTQLFNVVVAVLPAVCLTLNSTGAIRPVRRPTHVVVIGGKDGPRDTFTHKLGSATWSRTRDSLPAPGRTFLAAATLFSRIYALGGYPNSLPFSTLSTVDVFDGITWQPAPSMTTARSNFAALALADKIYAVGGVDASEPNILRSVEAFDPQTQTWESRSSMLVGRYDHALVSVGNYLYVIGGSVNTNERKKDVMLREVERYDPKIDKWSPVVPMIAARSALSAAAMGGKIYAFGGGDGPTAVLQTAEVYDTSTKRWSPIADMPTPRWGAGAVANDGLIYVIGGQSGAGLQSAIAVYHPKANAWSHLAAKLKPAPYFSGIALWSAPKASNHSVVVDVKFTQSA